MSDLESFIKSLELDTTLTLNGIEPVVLLDYQLRDNQAPIHERKFLVNDLQLDSSLFLNKCGNVYQVPKIPRVCLNTKLELDYYESKLAQICNEFSHFQFGGISFTCTHDYWWGPDQKDNARAKDMFERLYRINISDVYISLNELCSVADHESLFTEIDDFFVTGNYDDTVLTILDNDLTYDAKGSCAKNECHFRPVFCIDRGVPVKYIKRVNDNNEIFRSRKYESEQRHKYAEQRTLTLKKLGEYYKTNNPNYDATIGYPTDIDFVVKTGLREFTFLCYDRSSIKGNFFITNVRYDNDGNDLKYIIRKCDFQNLPKTINAIQCARVSHFNKMYNPKVH